MPEQVETWSEWSGVSGKADTSAGRATEGASKAIAILRVGKPTKSVPDLKMISRQAGDVITATVVLLREEEKRPIWMTPPPRRVPTAIVTRVVTAVVQQTG